MPYYKLLNNKLNYINRNPGVPKLNQDGQNYKKPMNLNRPKNPINDNYFQIFFYFKMYYKILIHLPFMLIGWKIGKN